MKEIISRDKRSLKEKCILLIFKNKNKIKEGKSWRSDPHFYQITLASTPKDIKLQVLKESIIKIPSESIKYQNLEEEMIHPASFFDTSHFCIDSIFILKVSCRIILSLYD